MCRKQTVMESLYYGHRKDDQSIFVRFERAAKQISYIPNHGCLFLCVRAYDSKFSFAIWFHPLIRQSLLRASYNLGDHRIGDSTFNCPCKLEQPSPEHRTDL